MIPSGELSEKRMLGKKKLIKRVRYMVGVREWGEGKGRWIGGQSGKGEVKVEKSSD